MPIDKKLFENLDITTGAHPSRILSPFRKKNIPDSTITQELTELDAIAAIAKEKNKQILRNLGETFSTTKRKSDPFSASWQEYTHNYVIRAKIAKRHDSSNSTTAANHNFADREIITNIQSSASNNAFNPLHVLELFESVFKAAQDLAPQDAEAKKIYLTKIQAIHDEFLTGTEYPKIKRSMLVKFLNKITSRKKHSGSDSDPDDNDGSEVGAKLAADLTKDSINKLMNDFKYSLAAGNLNLDSIINRNIFLERLFIGRLATALWQAEKGRTNVPSKNTYQEYVARIREQDILNASTNRRPILINIYKQEVVTNDPLVSHYIMVTQIPNSDISSANRSLEGMMFSNDWTVVTEALTIQRNKKGEVVSYTKGPPHEYIRSSSIARITYNKKTIIDANENLTKIADAEKFKHVYEAFKKLVIQYAREDLIKKINNNEDISEILSNNELILKEAYITLLSPLNDIKTGEKYTASLGKNVTDKTIHENEAEQLATTKQCLLRIVHDKTLKFSNEDCAEIIHRTKNAPNRDQNITIESLQRLRIKHKSYFCNYMVNKLGAVDTEKIGRLFFKSNRKYFLAGNKIRRDWIADFIEHSKELDTNLPPNIRDLLRSKLIALFQHNDAESIADDIQPIMEDYRSRCPELYKILSLYIDIEKYFNKSIITPRLSTKAQQARIAESYLTAAKDVKLGELLGFKAHVTCKSGVDRTGLFASFLEALSCNDGKLVTNLLLSLQHGANTTIKSINAPGIYGQQISSNALEGMLNEGGDSKLIKKFFSEGKLNKIGKMIKAIYSHTSAMYELVVASIPKQTSTTRTEPLPITYRTLPPTLRQSPLLKASANPVIQYSVNSVTPKAPINKARLPLKQKGKTVMPDFLTAKHLSMSQQYPQHTTNLTTRPLKKTDIPALDNGYTLNDFQVHIQSFEYFDTKQHQFEDKGQTYQKEDRNFKAKVRELLTHPGAQVGGITVTLDDKSTMEWNADIGVFLRKKAITHHKNW